jgi:aldehyde:ferredoxin oxidoreductase
MLMGYKGKALFIDLTRESAESLNLPENILFKYVGGRGLAAKLFWDLATAKCDPLGPENIFMFITGPLTGTIAPCACKYLVATKSPATNMWLESYSTGQIANELKFAGYDALILLGKASKPTYIEIEDDTVLFKGAESLWGKGAFETETYIKEHFDPTCGVMVIGPAGENLIPFANVGSEYFRKAGRGGAGAVLGSKNVKAVAIKGSSGISCSNMRALYHLVGKHHELYKQSSIGIARHRHGTPLTVSITNAAGMLPTRNFSSGQFEEGIGSIDKDGLAKIAVGDKACYGCFLSCSKITEVKEGPFAGTRIEGPEYETIGLLGSNLGIDYLPAIVKANYICDDLGMDTISAGGVIGFAMECYERGILSKEQTDGLDLKFGNYKAALNLLELMGRKRNFGEFCSSGVKEMAKRLKSDTARFAMHSKGLELPAYDPRAGWGSTITYSVSARGGCHRRAWPALKEVLGGIYPFTTEGKARLVIDMMNDNGVMHSLIVCDFPGKFVPIGADDWAQYLSAVTGHSTTGKDLLECADLTETLIRCINIREGLTCEDDVLPKRILEEALPSGPPMGRIIGKERFLKMRGEYYAARGWNAKGEPLKKTLEKWDFENDEKIAFP